MARTGLLSQASLVRPPVAWARDVLRDPRTVFLDTETTGLGPDAEVVEIAVLAVDGAVLLDTLVRPSRPIPTEAWQVHGIRDDDVRDAPAWDELHPRLDALLSGLRVVVYHADFDSRVLRGCCVRCGKDLFVCDWNCAMLAFAEFAGERDRYGRGFKWHRLDAAASRFGIPAGVHRALSDAETCRLVVHRMAEAGF